MKRLNRISEGKRLLESSRSSPPPPSSATMVEPPTAATYGFAWGPSAAASGGSRSRIIPDFSPPLIAMVAVVGIAILIVLYVYVVSGYLRRFRSRWRRRRRLLLSTSSVSDIESQPPGGGGGGGDGSSFGSSSDYFISPFGFDDSAIKALPQSIFSKSKARQLAATNRDCAVCLLEFEDNDSLRTLPLCCHAFHVDCIDVWLRSHATCPLCRATVFSQDSPFVPMRAARIRPSFDDLFLYPLPEPHGATIPPETESDITHAAIAGASPPPIRTEDRFGPRDFFLLKRSYSFGFERSIATESMVLETSTISPWRYRHHHRSSFWSKRWPSPFGGVGGGSCSASRAARVFSFRSYRGASVVKSPFLRRRSFFPLSSETIGSRLGVAGPSSSLSQRSRSMTSPSAAFM